METQPAKLVSMMQQISLSCQRRVNLTFLSSRSTTVCVLCLRCVMFSSCALLIQIALNTASINTGRIGPGDGLFNLGKETKRCGNRDFYQKKRTQLRGNTFSQFVQKLQHAMQRLDFRTKFEHSISFRKISNTTLRKSFLYS